MSGLGSGVWVWLGMRICSACACACACARVLSTPHPSTRSLLVLGTVPTAVRGMGDGYRVLRFLRVSS
jgi:hypothetical protein